PKSGVQFLKKGKISSVEKNGACIKATAATDATILCKKNLVFAEIPLFFLIFDQSSKQPIHPKPIKQPKNIQTSGLRKFVHKRAFIRAIVKINTPPIMGILSLDLCILAVNPRVLERKNC